MIVLLPAHSSHVVARSAPPLPRGSRLLRTGRLGRRAPGALAGLWHDTGAVTAEYAVATLAAVGFAGVLVVVLRSDEVRSVLLDLIRGALSGG